MTGAPPKAGLLERRRATALILGLSLVVLTALALSLHMPGQIWAGTLARKDAIVMLMLISAALWGLAVRAVLRDRLRGLRVVLGAAIVLRVMLIAAPPFMSSDVYRYVWDGRVQAAGINPYAHKPGDEALAALRDDAVWPNINRRNTAVTIYPPAAEMLFAGVGVLRQGVTAMKIALCLVEAAGIVSMLLLLRMARMRPERILIYAWNPLALWAVAGDGHIDGAAIGLLGLAMLMAMRGRQGWTGMVLGAAILTKFLPAAVAPALWRRWGWRMPVACAATMAVLYACYADVGWRVLGFLGGYTREEGLRGGSGFFLLAMLERVAVLPGWAGIAYVIAAMAGLLCLAWVVMRRAPSPPEPVKLACGMGVLAFATMLAMSPHYPWYFVWLALPCCLCPLPCVLWLSAAPLLLYSDPWHDEIGIEAAVFLPAMLLAVRDLAHAWRHTPDAIIEARRATA